MLRPGQYWAIPISNGRFACGRVMQLNTPEIPTKSRTFFGGLHDWVRTKPPSPDSIARASFVAFGVMHIRAITTTGGAVLGVHPLQADAIPKLLSAHGGSGTMLLHGADPIREARPEEWGTLPVLGFWGYNFIRELAESRFGNRSA